MSGNIKYYNLTGGLNTVQGLGTINQSNRRTESPDMQNVEYYKLGGLRSMEGNVQFANTLPAQITLGYECIRYSEAIMIVTTIDGIAYKYDKLSNSFIPIYKFPTPTNRHSACDFNQGVVLSNGVDDLVFYQAGRNTQLKGTVSLTNESKTVIGKDTLFKTELSVGDYIRFSGVTHKSSSLVEGYRIDKIVSDNELELSEAIEIDAGATTYYAWTVNGNSIYTTTTDPGSNIDIYAVSNGSPTLQSYKGVINQDGSLKVTTTTSGTVDKKIVDYYCVKGVISGPVFVQEDSAALVTDQVCYFYFSPTGVNGQSLKGSKWISGNYVGWSKTDNKDNLSDVYINRVAVNMWQTSNDPLLVQSISNGIPLKAGCAYKKGFPGFYFDLSREESGDITHTVRVNETVISTDTYNRDSANDKTLQNPVTDINYYLTEISEANAILVNEDDASVQSKIRGLAIQGYQGRLWVGCTDGTLYYSEVGLLHGWNVKYDAGGIPVFYDDNSAFTALVPWSKYLMVCRKEHSYLLDATNDDSGLWQLEPYSDYTCESQQSWVIANNMLLTYARQPGGIFPLAQRTIYNNLMQGAELSAKVRDSLDYINQAKSDYIFPVYHPKKNYIMFYMPMLTGEGSNSCFIFDVKSKTWLFRKVPQDVSIAFRFNNEIYLGTKEGKVLKEFSGNTFDKKPIEFYWRSPWLSFGDISNYKSTREFRINLSEESNNRFHVRNRRDGVDSYKDRKVTNNQNAFSGLVWDTDTESQSVTDTVWDEDSWVKVAQVLKRFPLPNQYFNTLQIEFYGNAIDEGMAMNGFEILGIQLEEVGY